MRLLYVTEYYPAFLKCLNLSGGRYDYLHAQLMAQRFAWSDVWTDVLAPYGIGCQTIVVNSAILQNAWASEYGSARGMLDIFRAQLAVERPDAVFYDGSDQRVFDVMLERKIPVVGWTGSRVCKLTWEMCALVLTCDRGNLSNRRLRKCRVRYFQHGFDKRCNIFRSAENDSRVVMVGTPMVNRYRLIADLHKQGIDVELVQAYGPEYYRLLSRAGVILNLHIAEATHANNMRLFEATGMGARVVTDALPGVLELFDGEAVTYHDADSCAEAIRWAIERGAAKSDRLLEITHKRHLLQSRGDELAGLIGGMGE